MRKSTKETLFTCLIIGAVHALGTLVTEAYHAYEDTKYTEDLVEDVADKTAKKVIDEMNKTRRR